MAFVLIARGPENLDDAGVGIGKTPVIVTVDGSPDYMIYNTVLVGTADADVPAALDAVAPKGSKQRIAWKRHADRGLDTVAPPDWKRLVFGEGDLGDKVTIAAIKELLGEIRALGSTTTNGQFLTAVKARVNA